MYFAVTPRPIFPRDGSMFTRLRSAMKCQRTVVGRRPDEATRFCAAGRGMAVMGY